MLFPRCVCWVATTLVGSFTAEADSVAGVAETASEVSRFCQYRSDIHLLSRFSQQIHNGSIYRRRQFNGCFVGHHFRQVLTDMDWVARLYQPFNEFSFNDPFA